VTRCASWIWWTLRHLRSTISLAPTRCAHQPGASQGLQLRRPPDGSESRDCENLQSVDQLRVGQFLQLIATFAGELLSPDDGQARQLGDFAADAAGLYRGVSLLHQAGRLDDFHAMGAHLNDQTRAVASQMSRATDVPSLASVVAIAEAVFDRLWGVVFVFLGDLAQAQTTNEAVAALDQLQAALTAAG
jgi:hypothetical protein